MSPVISLSRSRSWTARAASASAVLAAAAPLTVLACGGGRAASAPAADRAQACRSPVRFDPLTPRRDVCTYAAGARPSETLTVHTHPRGRIEHLVVVMQENRSFDHYFGRLPAAGKHDVDGWPATYANLDARGAVVRPFHLTPGRLAADPPHQGAAMLAGWNGGRMDGFVRSAATGSSDGHFVLGYYEESDLPFYYFLAKTFAMSDRYFGSALAGTWANRNYLYAGTSEGVTDTGSRVIDARTVFDALTEAKVSWRVFTDGLPRQDSLGWDAARPGVGTYPDFLAAVRSGTLPAVTFVDPWGEEQDEHPASDPRGGERWGREIYEAARRSPQWPSMALIYTYDESGGLADHVPPPTACLAAPSETRFDHYGLRVPFILVSPWARRGYVSHVVHDHTSILRLVELLHDLPALTGRDANAGALLDLFDFECPPDVDAPPAPALPDPRRAP